MAPEADIDDTEVDIEDEDTPLFGGDHNDGNGSGEEKQPWWWWILLVIAAITGKVVYDKNKKKFVEADGVETIDETDETNE